MGIENLNPIIAKYCPNYPDFPLANATGTIAISDFRGKRIAIDACRLIYAEMANVRSDYVDKMKGTIAFMQPNPAHLCNTLVARCLDRCITWLQRGVTPVLVFDGPSRPEKLRVKNKRKAGKVNTAEAINEIYRQMEAQPQLRTDGLTLQKLTKLSKERKDMPYETVNMVQVVLKGVGIPVLKAIYDAEELCALLCIEKQVAAVHTTDTDALAFGAPLLITGFSKTNSNHLNYYRLDYVLQGLKLNQTQFVDMCIMAGCDYNVKIRGFGVVKTYETISQHGSIEAFASQTGIDCQTLAVDDCRRIFAYAPSQEVSVPLPDPPQLGGQPQVQAVQSADLLSINREALNRAPAYLQMVGIDLSYMRDLINCYSGLTHSGPGWVDSLKLLDPRTITSQLTLPRAPFVLGDPFLQVILTIFPSSPTAAAGPIGTIDLSMLSLPNTSTSTPASIDLSNLKLN